MKKLVSCLIVMFFLLANDVTNAQSVAINNDGAAPDSSAIVDIASRSKGLLIPRMNSNERNSIVVPAQGLLVFDTDMNNIFVYKGTGWTELGSSSGGSGYWSSNGSNIYNTNAGDIGIGTSSPGTSLHIKRNNEAVRIEGSNAYISFYDNSGIYKGYLWQGTDNNISLGTAVGNTTGRIEFHNNGVLASSIDNTGSFQVYGISASLKLNQNGITGGELKVNGNNLEISARRVLNGAAGNLILQADDASGASTGNVGIGTINPTYKLSVNGNVRAKEIIVESGWADYVFQDDYKLKPLNEVEDFIRANKHLPNIPSAIEIQTSGLSVGETQKKMMEKIEELTLYIIQQQKEIDFLKKAVPKTN